MKISRTDLVGQNGNDAEIYHHLHRHGHRPKSGCSPTYSSWVAMKHRCNNSASHNYHLYGGRGISVHPRWSDFVNFLADMGDRPEGTSLDREDPDGDYCPGNCRWATSKQQARNRRTSVLTEVDGVLMNLVDVADDFGIPRTTLYRRYRQGVRGVELVCKANRNNRRVGSLNHSSKLTALDVLGIRARVAAGEKAADLAAEFQVAQPTISNIVRRRTWNHI